MKTILTALLISAIGAIAQQAGSSPIKTKPSLQITLVKPKTSGQLEAGEELLVKVHYENPGTTPLSIFVRPFSKDKSAEGATSHSSRKGQPGSGDIEGWFYFIKSTQIDEIRAEMQEEQTHKVVATTTLPVQLAWKGVNANPTPLSQHAEAIVGHWRSERILGGAKLSTADMYFQKDGRFRFVLANVGDPKPRVENTGAYKLREGLVELTTDSQNPTMSKYTLAGDTLVMTTLLYRRVFETK